MSWIITGTQRYQPAALLDQFPGAAAAYSLRNLVGTSNPAVVRVRRSNDNAEQDFTATEVSDGTLAAWVGAGNDGFVRTWYDQSGNANNAEQTTAANQPQIISNGSVIETNSRPCVNFDGVNDRLINNSVSSAQPNTILIAAKQNAATQSGSFVDSYNNTQCIVYLAGNQLKMAAGSVLSSSVLASTDLRLITAAYSGSQSLLHVNTLQAVSGNAGNNSYSGLSIGDIRGNPNPILSGYAINARFFEIVIYPLILSTTRAAIEANINAHYNIF